MRERLKDELLNELPSPERGNKIYYDAADKDGKVVGGFGVRVTPNGKKVFIFSYRRKGDKLQRRFTIGPYSSSAGGWSVAAAREKAANLRVDVDNGKDPVGDLRTARQATSVPEQCDNGFKDASESTPARQHENEFDSPPV